MAFVSRIFPAEPQNAGADSRRGQRERLDYDTTRAGIQATEMPICRGEADVSQSWQRTCAQASRVPAFPGLAWDLAKEKANASERLPGLLKNENRIFPRYGMQTALGGNPPRAVVYHETAIIAKVGT